MQIEEMMLAELEPKLRELFTQVKGLGCGWSILRLLYQRANALMMVDDIAYHVGESRKAVERDLEALIDLGLARKVELAGAKFFGLTEDPELRQAVHDLCSWQERWRHRLAQIASAVDG